MHFLHNDVSSDGIQAYLRQGTQIEQVWQQVDDKVSALILQGVPPWEAYSTLGHALAFARACRLSVVLAQKLVEGADPTHTGYIPRPIYDQAQALGETFEPYMEEALRLLNPGYTSRQRIPLQLRRARYEGKYSSAHLLGVLAAAQETREWAAGLLAQYELAIAAPKLPIPPAISAHLETMKNQLALGTFHQESGSNLIGSVRGGQQVPDAVAAQGETLLWEAMESFYEVSQLIAYPAASHQPAHSAAAPPPPIQQHHARLALPAPSPDQRAITAANVADLLGQLGQAHPAGTPVQPAVDTSGLLDQLQLTKPPPSSPALPSDAAPANQREPSQEHASAEQRVSDLLSDIGGDQQSHE